MSNSFHKHQKSKDFCDIKNLFFLQINKRGENTEI